MCEPTTIMAVGMAVSAAVSMAQMSQAKSNQKDMVRASNDANVAELERQTAKQNEAQGVFGEALDKYEGTDAKARENEAVANREQAMTQAMNPDMLTNYSPSQGAGAGPAVVKSEIARKIAGALSAGKRNAQNLARLQAPGDFGLGNMIDLGRSKSRLGDIGQLSQGSAALHGIESQTAVNNAYSPPSPWLEAGKAAGDVAAMYGANEYSLAGTGGRKHTDASWNTFLRNN